MAKPTHPDDSHPPWRQWLGRPVAPTIAGVARAAGVSRSTASRVLADPDGHGHAADGARRRILAAAWRIGYRLPNAPADRPPASALIGLLVSAGESLPDSHLQGIPEQLLQLLDRRGLDLALLVDRDWRQWRLRGRLAAVRGLIVPDLSSSAWEDLRPELRGLPRVLLNWEDDASEDAVLPDDALGATLAAEHLLHLGHRRLLFIGPPATGGPLAENPYLNHRSLPVRRSAIAAAVAAAGGALSEAPCDPPALLASLRTKPAPTGLILLGGCLLPMVLATLADARWRIPDQLSLVVGNDCQAALSRHITAVDVPYARLAEHAVTLLCERMMRGAGPRQRICLPESLTVRGSTGPNAIDPKRRR